VSWVRLDDGFADHPKVAELDDRAFRIHVWALCYSARHLTDGFLAHEALAGCPLVTRRYTLDRAQEGLVSARLWVRRKRGFQIRDYLSFNPSRAQVQENVRRTLSARPERENARRSWRYSVSHGVTEKSVTLPPSPPQRRGETAPRL
jgi:hypothetical protein